MYMTDPERLPVGPGGLGRKRAEEIRQFVLDRLVPGEFTTVFMRIDPRSSATLSEMFEHYAAARDDYAFSKTNVVLRLLATGDDASFVSRSQAKRVLARLPRFKEVLLDFEGVKSIGPAFSDEIFRVFASAHPDVHLTPMRATDDVARMIQRARDAKANPE